MCKKSDLRHLTDKGGGPASFVCNFFGHLTQPMPLLALQGVKMLLYSCCEGAVRRNRCRPVKQVQSSGTSAVR